MLELLLSRFAGMSLSAGYWLISLAGRELITSRIFTVKNRLIVTCKVQRLEKPVKLVNEPAQFFVASCTSYVHMVL